MTGFIGKSTKYIRKIFTPTLYKLAQDRIEILLNSFHEGSITLIPKLDKKHFKKRKLQANIPHEHEGSKNPQKYISKTNPATYKNDKAL